MEYKVTIALFFCHFLADFTPLSTPWMLQAKALGKPWHPILAHAAVHSGLMGVAILIFWPPVTLSTMVGVMFFQLNTHFWIDLGKGKVSEAFPSVRISSNSWYWIVFGFDQFLHAVVIIKMVTFLKPPF